MIRTHQDRHLSGRTVLSRRFASAALLAACVALGTAPTSADTAPQFDPFLLAGLALAAPTLVAEAAGLPLVETSAGSFAAAVGSPAQVTIAGVDAGTTLLGIDWGDGADTTLLTAAATHTFAIPGTYFGHAVVVDDGAVQLFEFTTVVDENGDSGLLLIIADQFPPLLAPNSGWQLSLLAPEVPPTDCTNDCNDNGVPDCEETNPCACIADLDGNGAVDGGDLGALLADWGGGGAADLNGDGIVDGADMGALLASLGPCA